jgi:cold shock CspA family protein
MKVPLEISFHGIESHEQVEERIRRYASKLERVCGYISSCRVAIEQPQHRRRTGNPLRVRIDLTVPPGHELVVEREQSKGYVHDPLEPVLRQAFGAARRRLQRIVQVQHGHTKVHPEQEPTGFVIRLRRDQGFGFIKGLDGGEVYFHRNSVLHSGFERLEVGTGVRFTEEAGRDGPQASSVEIVDKPGARAGGSAHSAVEPPLGWGK